MQSVTLDTHTHTHTHTCGASLECVSPSSLIVCGFVSASFVLAHVSRVCYLKRLSVQPGHPVSVYLNCRSLPFLSHCRFLSYYAISCPLSPVCVAFFFFRLVSVAVSLLIINFLLSTGRAPRCAAKESHHQQRQSLCICLYDLYNLHICPSELVRSGLCK